MLELEPREAERLPLPLTGAERLDIASINRMLQTNDIDGVLDITDQVLLREGMGLDMQDIRMLRGIWQKLRNRRINRK